MTELRVENILLNAADIGGTNPMPDMFNVSYIHARCDTTDNLTAEDKKYFGKGKINTILPYLSQDRYDRNLKNKSFKAIILENEKIKAIFLPELGGRLWSLYHKVLNRELLYVNDIVQPGNLAIRNAWVAGGVEFNEGIKGHSVFTCSSLFAAEGKNENGEPILSMYEYNRIRGTVFCLNAYIPNDDDKLYIRTTIENNSGKDTFTYWWSNIAVPEKGVRVITDAEKMFTCAYEDNHYIIDKVDAPYFNGTDISRPEDATHAGDVFYVTNEGRKWIASPEEDGIGLLQYSTPELIGRKTFFWGQKPGGRNWNRHLCGSDRAYIEIQAGLRYMQMEHLPIKDGETISFTECYTALNLDNKITHGELDTAKRTISDIVNSMPDPALCPIPLDCEKKIIHMGSGFGALEEKKLSKYCIFPKESLGEEQRDWISLEENGYLDKKCIGYYPVSYKTDKETLSKLEKSAATEEGDHWYTYLHIGTVRFANEDYKGALDAFLKSIEKEDNALARRNIAMLYKNIFSENTLAVDNILRAYELSDKSERGLIGDVATILTNLGEDEKWLAIYNELPECVASVSRIKLYSAIALLHLGRAEEACEYVDESFEMPDIKEGELSISAIWDKMYGDKKPLPNRLNFRMFET